MLKINFLLLSLIGIINQALAQVSPPTNQYGILETQRKSKAQVVMVFLDGTPAGPNTSQESTEEAFVKKSLYEIDALNYLAAHGWEIIAITAETFNGHTCGNRYYFKKR